MDSATVGIRIFAKINLFLRIVGKRDDGFHEVETVMHPVGLYDELHVSPSNNGFHLECDAPDCPTGPENTILRACHLLKDRFPKRVGTCRIRVSKGIPTQAGMGGASADAAGTLLALDRLFGLGLSQDELMRLGASIGSDVAFFLSGGPAVCTGRGETIRPLEGHLEAPVALAVSRDGVSTSEAYSRFRPDAAEQGLTSAAMQEAVRKGDAREASQKLFNTFERLIYPVRPDLQRIRLALLASGASGALLTGSGATVFALGLTETDVQRARTVLDPMGRETVYTALQPKTYQWLSERGTDPRSDPS